MLQVVAGVGRHLPDGDPLQGGVPARGVVRAALPGMVDGDEARSLGITRRRQITVPGEQTPVVAFEEDAGAGDALLVLAPRGLPDAPDGYGVHGWLAQAAGPLFRGRVLGERRRVPALRVGEVAPGRRLGVEDDVGHLARGPLAPE